MRYEVKNLTFAPLRLIINGNNIIITEREDTTNNPIFLETLPDEVVRLSKLGMLKIRTIKK
jgi:hypothetical protein